MTQQATQRPCFVEGEEPTPAVGFVDQLRSGELLTGTPTVTELSTSDLTISNEGLNGSEIEVDGETHSASQAVQFKITGQLAATGSYRLRVDVDTDASPAQKLSGFIEFDVVAKT